MMGKGDIIKADVKHITEHGYKITLIGSARIELITETTGRIKKGIGVYGRNVWLNEAEEWMCESGYSQHPMFKEEKKDFRDMIDWGLRDH